MKEQTLEIQEKQQKSDVNEKCWQVAQPKTKEEETPKQKKENWMHLTLFLEELICFFRLFLVLLQQKTSSEGDLRKAKKEKQKKGSLIESGCAVTILSVDFVVAVVWLKMLTFFRLLFRPSESATTFPASSPFG